MILLHADSHDPLPVDPFSLVRTRLLVAGTSGCGKTTLLRSLLLQTPADLPFAILDPEGEFAQIAHPLGCALATAEPDADLPLDERTAPELARTLLETGRPLVLDLSELPTDVGRRTVRAFLDELMAAPRHLWRPTLIALDEAHRFAPQGVRVACSAAVADLASRGRKRGYGLIAATQRLSKLDKDVAAELTNLLIGRTTLDTDRARAADLLGLTTQDKEALRHLPPGTFWAAGPALAPTGYLKVQAEGENALSSRLHSAGASHISLSALPPIQAAAPVVSAPSDGLDDPNADADNANGTRIQVPTTAAVSPVAPDVLRAAAELGVALHRHACAHPAGLPALAERATALADAAGRLLGYLEALGPTILPDTPVHETGTPAAGVRKTLANGQPGEALAGSGAGLDGGQWIEPAPGGGSATQTPPLAADPVARIRRLYKHLSACHGQERLLIVLGALHPTPLTREQLRVLIQADYTERTVAEYLRTLVASGLVRRTDGNYSLTLSGQDALGLHLMPPAGAPSVLGLPLDEAGRIELWRLSLGGLAGQLLTALAQDAKAISTGELGRRAGVPAAQPRFTKALRHLRELGLVRQLPNGGLVLTPIAGAPG